MNKHFDHGSHNQNMKVLVGSFQESKGYSWISLPNQTMSF